MAQRTSVSRQSARRMRNANAAASKHSKIGSCIPLHLLHHDSGRHDAIGYGFANPSRFSSSRMWFSSHSPSVFQVQKYTSTSCLWCLYEVGSRRVAARTAYPSARSSPRSRRKSANTARFCQHSGAALMTRRKSSSVVMPESSCREATGSRRAASRSKCCLCLSREPCLLGCDKTGC